MRLVFLVALLLCFSLPSLPQACTNPGSGNVCSPAFMATASVAKHGNGTAADGSWALINHAVDTASSDLGCYYSGQIKFAYHNLGLTMVGGTYQCGQSNHTEGSQSYLTGSMMWNNLNYKPSEMSSGHVHMEIKAQMGRGWSAIWLLGGSGNNSGAAGCQYSSINDGWDNIDNCNWDSDGSDSGEVDIAEFTPSDYTHAGHNKFVNSSDACSETITSAIANVHLYQVDWTSSNVKIGVDGSGACNYNTNIPQNPMFLVIEDRQISGTIDNNLPTTTTVYYVQVCDGSSCTAPDSTGGNTVFLDDFATGTVSINTINGESRISGNVLFQ